MSALGLARRTVVRAPTFTAGTPAFARGALGTGGARATARLTFTRATAALATRGIAVIATTFRARTQRVLLGFFAGLGQQPVEGDRKSVV